MGGVGVGVHVGVLRQGLKVGVWGGERGWGGGIGVSVGGWM